MPKKKKKIKHGAIQKASHLLMGFFTPSNFVTHCQSHSNTFPVLFTKLH